MFELQQQSRPGPLASAREPSALSGSVALLAAVLDEVDIPMLVVDADGRLLHANRLARLELADDHHPLAIADAQVRVRASHRTTALGREFDGAVRGGRRRMLPWSGPDSAGAIGVVPLEDGDPVGGARSTLLVLGRRQLCSTLTIDWFARNHSLTDFEARVLRLLCAGLRPHEVAERHGVAVSTVRTQVNSIRAKTLADSVGDLVARVACMPPMVSRYETSS